ncbi:MAG: cyclic nucleotide-binding domain-containing protein [Candidatus Hydrogenedentes bacterium]|nr:cyclic nucleotide-binding domain-containing protein [Candidatus Hydrogenedentota bacterium]
MEENLAKYQKLVDHVDIFHGLRPADVHKIFQKGMTVRVTKGETVFYKETEGNQMYVILGGKVGVFDGPKMLAKLTVGMTFGEISLLNNEPRTATIVALEATNLLMLSEEVFQKLLTKRVAVQILLNMSRMMGKRLAASNLMVREQEGR